MVHNKCWFSLPKEIGDPKKDNRCPHLPNDTLDVSFTSYTTPHTPSWTYSITTLILHLHLDLHSIQHLSSSTSSTLCFFLSSGTSSIVTILFLQSIHEIEFMKLFSKLIQEIDCYPTNAFNYRLSILMSCSSWIRFIKNDGPLD